MLLVPVVEELDLHPRDVDPDRALALARLARDAEVERFFHFGRSEGLGPELPAEREPQAVGPPRVTSFSSSGRLVARAHHRLELAALPVVVAHLGRGEEPAALGPIERGADGQCTVAGLVAEEGAIIHLRRAHDLARIEEAPGSKVSFTCSKARTTRSPNIISWNSERLRPSPCSPECEPLYSLTIANASSAMARIFLAPDSSFMFRMGRTCRQPTEACAYQVLGAVLAEEVGQPVGELRQPVEAERRSPR